MLGEPGPSTKWPARGRWPQAAGVAVLLLVSGCTLAAGATPAAGRPEPTPTPTERVGAATVRPDAPAACPVTVPNQRLVPPDPYLPAPPASYHSAWFGTADLWTMLDLRGEVWWALPHGSGGFGQKTFWWSRAFDASHEPEPAISVNGRRLDTIGPTFESVAPGTNAAADFGSSMLVGIEIPTSGCWEIKAAYRGHALEYVVWVAGD